MGEKRGTVLTLLLINLQYVTVHVTEENTFIFANTFKNVLYVYCTSLTTKAGKDKICRYK